MIFRDLVDAARTRIGEGEPRAVRQDLSERPVLAKAQGKIRRRFLLSAVDGRPELGLKRREQSIKPRIPPALPRKLLGRWIVAPESKRVKLTQNIDKREGEE